MNENQKKNDELIRSWDLRYENILKQRSTFDELWRSLARYVLPNRPRFHSSDTNNGDGENRTKILDSTATFAVEIAKSGLLAGMASPSRPWFGLRADDPELNEDPEVKQWLEDFRDAMLGVFERSNFYQSLGAMFQDELVFGTACMILLNHPEKTVRYEVFPIGSYALANSYDGRVDTFVREYEMTVRQAASEFGEENLSIHARNSIRQKQMENRITIRHAIWPRTKHDKSSPYATDMPWAELYWERKAGAGTREHTPNWGAAAGGGAQGGLLREGGYREFPVIAARWSRGDADIYATNCPCMIALGDIRMLQSETRKHLNALDKEIDPPLLTSPELADEVVSLLPGAQTSDPGLASGKGTRPVHEINYPYQESRNERMETRDRIGKALMTNLFLMLLNDDRRTPATAEEVRARSAEKMTVLGPTMERHADDVFGPVISRVSAMMIRDSQMYWELGMDGIVPMPPEQMQGQDFKPVYVSEIAQAQKMSGLGTVERHVQFVGGMAQLEPSTLDIIDWDELVREHAEVLGLPPKLTRDEDDVADMRELRAQQQAAAAQAEQAPAMAGAAKDLSQADIAGESALEMMAREAGAVQ